MRKLCLFSILLLLVPCMIAAADSGDIRTAVTAIRDTAFSAVASYLSGSQIQIDNLVVNVPEGSSVPDWIVMDELDMSTLLPHFEPKDDWMSQMLESASPLNSVARAFLEAGGYEKGDVIVDGSAMLRFDKDASIATMISRALKYGEFPKVAVAFEIECYGERFDEKIASSGTMIVGADSEGVLQIRTMEAEINGEKIDINQIIGEYYYGNYQ